MKRILTLFLIITVLSLLSACGIYEDGLEKYFGFDADEFVILEEKDTHGGFHGDGNKYMILDCSKNAEKARNLVKDWKSLPFSENLNLYMYGGEKKGESYGYKFAEEAHLPIIENGVYKFVDRHSEAKDPYDDSELLDRYSINFSVAVYDFDTDKLYYFEIDT